MLVWQLKQTCSRVCAVRPKRWNRLFAACFLQKYVWKGELNAGSYYLLPFTSGCKLKKKNKKNMSGKSVQLINRTDTDEIDLSRELRSVWKYAQCCLFSQLPETDMGVLLVWPQGGAVGHIWHHRRWWKWLGQFGGVQPFWAAHQWRGMR